MDRAEAALFFLLAVLPGLVIYGGWILCAFDWVRGRAAIPVWISSTAVTIDYFILLRPFARAGFDQPFEVLSAAWLLVATGLGIQGLLSASKMQLRIDQDELGNPQLQFGSGFRSVV